MSGPWAAVVGGVNIDICGKSAAPLVARDSNPGTVRTSLGGVGRNVAHNLALLGVKTRLLTALGEDENARRVARSCRELGIDLSWSPTFPGGATSTYLVIADPQGEAELAVSDMAIYDRLTPACLADRVEALNGAALVAVDANLPAEALDFLAQALTPPLFADPVSTAKAQRLRPILGRLHTLKVNRLEAAALSGVDTGDDAGLERAARVLLDRGVERVFLTLGPQGALAADRREMVRLPICPGPRRNATGCGDAFLAALAWGWLEGLGLTGTARAGLAAAAIALAGEETVNPALCAEKLRALANLEKRDDV